MAIKKKAKLKPKAARPPAPKKRAAPVPGEKSDAQFLIETFGQVQSTLARVPDPDRKKALKARLDALRSKFKGLPKEKKTSERAVRYGEELHKIAADIISACCP
jgi:hypothetical protein